MCEKLKVFFRFEFFLQSRFFFVKKFVGKYLKESRCLLACCSLDFNGLLYINDIVRIARNWLRKSAAKA